MRVSFCRKNLHGTVCADRKQAEALRKQSVRGSSNYGLESHPIPYPRVLNAEPAKAISDECACLCLRALYVSLHPLMVVKAFCLVCEANRLLKTCTRTCGSKPRRLSETTVAEGSRGSDVKVGAAEAKPSIAEAS